MELKHLDFSLTEKAAPASGEFVGSWVISSNEYDRVNDRITLPALKSLIGKDVICLWQHNSDQPVGVWKNLRMQGNKLISDLKLAETNLGKMIKELLAIDTPLGASVGFRGTGKQNEKGGWDFDQVSLLETSIVSVPCNASAMQIAKSFDCEKFLGAQSSGADGAGNSAHSRDRAAVILKAKSVILTANKSLR